MADDLSDRGGARLIDVDDIQFSALFVRRTKSLLYDLCDEDQGYGWIGGHAPTWFDDKQHLVDDAAARYSFYLVVGRGALGRQ